MLREAVDFLLPPVALTVAAMVNRVAGGVRLAQGIHSVAQIVIAHYREKLYGATIHQALIVATRERDRLQRDLRHTNAALHALAEQHQLQHKLQQANMALRTLAKSVPDA